MPNGKSSTLWIVYAYPYPLYYFVLYGLVNWFVLQRLWISSGAWGFRHFLLFMNGPD
jgi:hypothetical protein